MARPAKSLLLADGDPPSEMSLEANILRYLANCLERRHRLAEGGITMGSPTQKAEAWLGYDSQVGLPDGQYILLQFKRPLPGCRTARFDIPSGQVRALLKAERGSAFFVLPVVSTNKDMWDAGTSLLGRALAVDAWDLYMPFAAGTPEGYGWIKSRRTHVRRVIADADGRATSLTQGGRWETPMRIPAMPVSRMCDTGDLGLVVKGGAVWTRGGRAWGGAEWRREAAKCRAAHAESDRRGTGADGLFLGDFDMPALFGDMRAGTGRAPRTPKGGPHAGGGLYALRIGGARRTEPLPF